MAEGLEGPVTQLYGMTARAVAVGDMDTARLNQSTLTQLFLTTGNKESLFISEFLEWMYYNTRGIRFGASEDETMKEFLNRLAKWVGEAPLRVFKKKDVLPDEIQTMVQLRFDATNLQEKIHLAALRKVKPA